MKYEHVLQAVDEELARDQQTIDQFIMTVEDSGVHCAYVGTPFGKYGYDDTLLDFADWYKAGHPDYAQTKKPPEGWIWWFNQHFWRGAR